MCDFVSPKQKVADGSGLVTVVSSINANKPNDSSEKMDFNNYDMVITLYDLGLRSREDVKQLIETGLFPDQLLAIKNEATVARLNLPKFSRRYRTNELSRKDQLSCIVNGELSGFTVVEGTAQVVGLKPQSNTQLKKKRAKLTKANFAFKLDGTPIQQHSKMQAIQEEEILVHHGICHDVTCETLEISESEVVERIEYTDVDAVCRMIDKLEKSDLAIIYRYAQRKYDLIPGAPVVSTKSRKKRKTQVVVSTPSMEDFPALVTVNSIETSIETVEVSKSPKRRRKKKKTSILFGEVVDTGPTIEEHGNVSEADVSSPVPEPIPSAKKKKVYYKPFVDQSPGDRPTFDFVLPVRTKQGNKVHECPIANYPLFLWKRALTAWPSLSVEEVAEKEFKRMVKSSLIHWTLQWKRSSTDRNPWLADWNATIRQLTKYDMKEWYNAYQAFRDRATSYAEKNSNPQWAIEPKQPKQN